MSDVREKIFNKIQAKLAVSNSESLKVARSRIARHERGPQPQWSSSTLERFTDKLTAAAGTYEEIANSAILPESIARYITRNKLDRSLTVAPHPLLESLTWPDDITVVYGTASASDVVTLSVAVCGIAETGSLMMISDASTPTSLNFLSDYFLCVLAKNNIVTQLEDAWDKWRSGEDDIPRVINFVTGPSRTADVEQIIQLGAHGPRQLHVIIIDNY